MCVTWTGDWVEAQEDIIAYKFVDRSGKDYRSPLPPAQRGSQDGRPVGKVLTYRLGKPLKSKEPGIYLLTEPVRTEEGATLVVKIPKGTKYRRGRASLQCKDGSVEVGTINALLVIPLREWVEPQYQWVWHVSASTSTTIQWNYVSI